MLTLSTNSHFVTFLGTQASTIKEWFKHQSDHLDERELHTDSNVTTEHFRPGRSDALKCNLTHIFNIILMSVNVTYYITDDSFTLIITIIKWALKKGLTY